MARQDPIVADGRQRLRGTERYRLEEREVRETIRERYEPELATTSGYERLVVEWKMWRELRRELDALASGRNLYLNPPG